MIVCIAEKPSVAKDIAEVLGAKQRNDGYYEGNGYQITWTFGHLCTLKEPHDYNENWKYWKLEDLPIVPPNFGIKLIQNQGVEKQFNTIARLVQNCNEVINCGDAGQEGELIQRWVLLKAKCKAPIKRLWISSLTEEAIKEGFEKLHDSKKYDNLYAAGSARAIGDWMLGINGTRLFTKKFGLGKSTLSIGRVQTPTLAMIVSRQKEIDAFTIAEYWELKTTYKGQEFNCQIDRLTSKDKAEKGLEYLKNKDFEITSFEQKEGKEGNPRMYDLTSLQVDANKKYGLSADDTLKLIQGLYEKKLVTYPRVDTTYLTEDLHPKIPNILKGLQYYSRFTESILANPIKKSKTVFDDKKVTDHHAVIPTGIAPSGVTPAEQNIYDLICRRFIAVFYPPCIVSNTTVLGKVESLEFKATGKQILAPGWKILYAKKKDEKSKNEEAIMPSFEKGEKGPHEPLVHKGKTSPPKHFTEATLLRSMESAGRQVEDEEMRELMKDNGIGRPSTRANIIETLFRRKYIEKKRKNIIATQTGIALIDTIQNELLKSAKLTGEWERKLRLIEKGSYDLEVFKQELYKMVRELTDEVIFNTPSSVHFFKGKAPESTVKPKKKRVKKTISFEEILCPKCKRATLIKGKTATGCSNFKSCGFKIPFELMEKKLTDTQLSDLITKGKTALIKGVIHPGTQQKVAGKFILDPAFNVQFEQVD
ncbi:MAG: DNA topoisomerase 3 [Crocinitomicaceae bacterium]|nr:DNA topoisomerase 3 [Crocinitomicaceae bacterium]MDG1777706.1 DNA topoisomerase 3 [Crocinitomicaceae bacterium]